MSTEETSRFVRLRVELVLEITDTGELTGAAMDQIGGDTTMPDDERAHAQASVRDDAAEALAYLVDPFDLVNGVPGVDLAQASWSSEKVDYDPASAEWDFDDEDEDFDGIGWIGEDGDRPDGEGGAGRA
ncbi:hypothetical protein ABT112_29470 [Streptomyces sp. NPDC002055]|uniref:hypothetical protein n=1 Tax=Streptomyces sp. NPDC002055 TaxID=3154534 RepID=UPI00332CBD02